MQCIEFRVPPAFLVLMFSLKMLICVVLVFLRLYGVFQLKQGLSLRHWATW